jgi:RIO kinase 1
MITSPYFRNSTILPYLEGDRRFQKIKRSSKSLIFTWVQKEFKNLTIAQEAGLRSPKPIDFEKNVLVMEFIGKDGFAAPQLIKKPLKDPQVGFEDIISQVEKLYKKKIIHGDISEYNILNLGEKPYIIDFAQGVLRSHPKSLLFLRRDIKNICNYFEKFGVNCSTDQIFDELTKK